MIDVKEAIAVLKQFKEESQKHKDSYTPIGSNLSPVLKIMQDTYQENIDAFEMAIKSLERTRWIPVSERLPEPYKSVLVCFISRNYRQDENPVLSTGVWCERAHDGPAWYSYPYGIKANVTHWMPLPSVPQEVDL